MAGSGDGAAGATASIARQETAHPAISPAFTGWSPHPEWFAAIAGTAAVAAEKEPQAMTKKAAANSPSQVCRITAMVLDTPVQQRSARLSQMGTTRALSGPRNLRLFWPVSMEVVDDESVSAGPFSRVRVDQMRIVRREVVVRVGHGIGIVRRPEP